MTCWSQAFSEDDFYHAIPADYDPRATGWISRCGALCTGDPIPTEEAGDRESCPKCLRMLYLPNTEREERGV